MVVCHEDNVREQTTFQIDGSPILVNNIQLTMEATVSVYSQHGDIQMVQKEPSTTQSFQCRGITI